MSEPPAAASHYGAHYREFADEVYSELRRAEFGEDFNQNNWLTLPELEGFADKLALGGGVHLLDIACGAGGPALHLAQLTGCSVTGVDLEQTGIANATRIAAEAGLAGRAHFAQADASRRLPFDDASFGAILCLDAMNHLPGRAAVLADWARLLAPGGRLLFTDAVTITGLVGATELQGRSAIGYFDFAPLGVDERLLREAGLDPIAVEDRTATHGRRSRGAGCDVRAERAEALRRSRATRDSSAGSASSTSSRAGAERAHLALRLPRAEKPR